MRPFEFIDELLLKLSIKKVELKAQQETNKDTRDLLKQYAILAFTGSMLGKKKIPSRKELKEILNYLSFLDRYDNMLIEIEKRIEVFEKKYKER